MRNLTSNIEGKPVERKVYCPGCGYDLHGIGPGKCPECGREFDREVLGKLRIPWVWRKRTGWVRAYWKTVLLATFRPTVVAGDAEWFVDEKEAKRFAWLTWGILALVGGGIGAWEYVKWRRMSPAPFTVQPRWVNALESPGTFGLLAVGVLIGFAVAIRVSGWFFWSRRMPLEKRPNAVAVSWYAGASLLLWPALVEIGMALLWLAPEPSYQGFHVGPLLFTGSVFLFWVEWLGWILIFAGPVLWWVDVLALLRKAGGAGVGRMIAAAVGWPLISAVLGVILAGLLILAVEFGAIVVRSLVGV